MTAMETPLNITLPPLDKDNQSSMYYYYVLDEASLLDLTGGRDFVSGLQSFNTPIAVLLVVFEVITPVSLALNLFVFFSCAAILGRQCSDRPALLFIAYNALLDLFISVADALVMTGAINPSLGTIPVGGDLPTEEQLTRRCSQEKGNSV